jgi:hypothetical protein
MRSNMQSYAFRVQTVFGVSPRDGGASTSPTPGPTAYDVGEGVGRQVLSTRLTSPGTVVCVVGGERGVGDGWEGARVQLFRFTVVPRLRMGIGAVPVRRTCPRTTSCDPAYPAE